MYDQRQAERELRTPFNPDPVWCNLAQSRLAVRMNPMQGFVEVQIECDGYIVARGVGATLGEAFMTAGAIMTATPLLPMHRQSAFAPPAPSLTTNRSPCKMQSMEYTQQGLNGLAKVQTADDEISVSVKLDGEGEFSEPVRFSKDCAKDLGDRLAALSETELGIRAL